MALQVDLGMYVLYARAQEREEKGGILFPGNLTIIRCVCRKRFKVQASERPDLSCVLYSEPTVSVCSFLHWECSVYGIFGDFNKKTVCEKKSISSPLKRLSLCL